MRRPPARGGERGALLEMRGRRRHLGGANGQRKGASEVQGQRRYPREMQARRVQVQRRYPWETGRQRGNLGGAAGRQEPDEPWDRLSLAFRNSALDDEFWRHRVVTTLCWYDVLAYLWASMYWVALFASLPPMPATPPSLWLLACPSLISLQLAAMYASFQRLPFYVEWRTLLVAGFRLCVIIVTTVTLYAPPPGGTPLGVATLFLQTPVWGCLVLGVGLQLPFRLHVPVQFLCCTLVMLLEPAYVRSWGLRDQALSVVCRSLGGAIDWGLRALVWVGPDPGVEGQEDQCACCLVMYFALWSVAFAVACGLIYCLESYCRMSFVLENGTLTRGERRLVRQAWRRAMPAAGLWTAVSVIVFWELLKAASLPAG